MTCVFLVATETEEGFVKLFSKKDVVEEHTEEGEGQAEEDDPNCPTFDKLRHMIKVLSAQIIYCLERFTMEVVLEYFVLCTFGHPYILYMLTTCELCANLDTPFKTHYF